MRKMLGASRGPTLRLIIWLGALLSARSAAFAADQPPTVPSEALFIAQIVLLLLVGRLLGEVMQRIGQPAVMGQLIAGVILGPSVFGALWPEGQHAIFPGGHEQKAMLEAVSDLGILMLLLLTGMETDLKLVKRARRAAVSVSAAGIAVPFVCGFVFGQFLPEAMLPRPDQRLITSLFLGTALSVASVKIVAMVVRETNFMRRKIGTTLVASAIIDDTVGWTIIAITSGLALHGVLNATTLAQSVLGTGLFLLVSFTLGRRLVFALIRWTNDTFVSEVPVVTAILVVMGAMALVTHLIGIHTVLGAFVAGILVGESPILTQHINEQLRGLVIALFMPVFFALAGLNADLSVLRDPHLLLLALGLIAIASVGKFSGAFLGGALGRLSGRESLALACGMNARGSTEVIVATIGLSLGVISHDLFTMIVTMAVVTTLAMPPMLRWALSRLPVHEEESALRTNLLPAETAITREAQKGYGLLVLGMAKTVSPHGGIARIAAMYEGPIAVVVARGVHVDVSQKGPLNVLVPVRGNKVSRRAAEVALALTRPSDPPLTALYVLSTVGLGAAQRRLKRPTPTRRHEEAVLKEIVELADHHGRSIRTALRLDVAAENAILRQASLGNYNLIVMGVGRPAGETLFFGRVAAAVLENSDRSLLFVSS
jgi:Kef-type K+ transport system membrane component KefB/nucleotide-binding universal stress UspA family protein